MFHQRQNLAEKHYLENNYLTIVPSQYPWYIGKVNYIVQNLGNIRSAPIKLF